MDRQGEVDSAFSEIVGHLRQEGHRESFRVEVYAAWIEQGVMEWQRVAEFPTRYTFLSWLHASGSDTLPESISHMEARWQVAGDPTKHVEFVHTASWNDGERWPRLMQELDGGH